MSQVPRARPYLLRETEGETLWFLGNLVTFKATGSDTRGRLTVAEFVHPAGSAPPLHRHLDEGEMFYLLSGTAEFRCDGQALQAGPGDFVLLPVGLPHTFIVGARTQRRPIPPLSPAPLRGTATNCSARSHSTNPRPAATQPPQNRASPPPLQA
jgi:quercetin dioxygenase-like cupin family protein